jgi:hypothetical protein
MIVCRKGAKAQRKAPNNQQEKSLRVCGKRSYANAFLGSLIVPLDNRPAFFTGVSPER